MSIFSRSITMTVVNRTPAATLAYADASASSGSTPTAQPDQVAPGTSMQITASNSDGACVGSFQLNGAGLNFSVSYDHPWSVGSTTVQASAPNGYLAFEDAASYSGHDVSASVSLYQGISVGTEGGFVAPLLLTASPSVNNCQDFANSMFGAGVRDETVVKAAYQNPAPNGYVTPADFTGSQIGSLVELWTDHWMGTANSLPQTDADLLKLLADYVQQASPTGALSMWVPQLAYQANSDDPPIFQLNGYSQLTFVTSNGAWDRTTVSAFLTLLAGGAHFVAISATDDLPENVSMQAFDSFFSASGLESRHDIGNSHYTSVLNITGTYYLSIGQDFAPANCGSILSFLVGRTVNSVTASNGTYNTFIQLEGWQSSVDSAWHNADYETFKKTLWNISTYGGCPYSEKRATTIFLAPPNWTPTVYQTTRMMPYVGAYATSSGAPQGWLNTAAVTIPSDSPPLPKRYWES